MGPRRALASNLRLESQEKVRDWPASQGRGSRAEGFLEGAQARGHAGAGEESGGDGGHGTDSKGRTVGGKQVRSGLSERRMDTPKWKSRDSMAFVSDLDFESNRTSADFQVTKRVF